MSDATLESRLARLRAPFPANQISKLPKPTRRDAPKGKCPECGGWHGLPAIHLDYVGHAALTDRLLEVDPLWTWEPCGTDAGGLPSLDPIGGLWIRLTVCGVTRLGYGHAGDKEGGDAIKELIGDALRNAAMRFGCALDLWHKGQLHVDDDPPTKPDPRDTAASITDCWASGDIAGAVAQWREIASTDRGLAVAVKKFLRQDVFDGLKAAIESAVE